MNLQELLGDSYKEGMTLEEINTALSSKKIADLSTGKYVDVDKHNREVDELNKKLKNKDSELKTNVANANDSQARIEQLENELKEQRRESNRNKAVAGISEAFSLLEMKDNDTEYTTFLDNVSELDKNVSSSIVSYFNKLVKSAYEKGKADGTKNGLGEMGKQKISSSTGSASEIGSLGKELAQMVSPTTTYDYFSRNK